jgi:hypothetical protein
MRFSGKQAHCSFCIGCGFCACLSRSIISLRDEQDVGTESYGGLGLIMLALVRTIEMDLIPLLLC